MEYINLMEVIQLVFMLLVLLFNIIDMVVVVFNCIKVILDIFGLLLDLIVIVVCIFEFVEKVNVLLWFILQLLLFYMIIGIIDLVIDMFWQVWSQFLYLQQQMVQIFGVIDCVIEFEDVGLMVIISCVQVNVVQEVVNVGKSLVLFGKFIGLFNFFFGMVGGFEVFDFFDFVGWLFDDVIVFIDVIIEMLQGVCDVVLVL